LGGLWYGDPDAVSNAIGYAKFRSRSNHAVIRVYDAAGNVIETHEHAGDFKEWWAIPSWISSGTKRPPRCGLPMSNSQRLFPSISRNWILNLCEHAGEFKEW
jgi:hypothetical protein